jgi:hypothetical protein
MTLNEVTIPRITGVVDRGGWRIQGSDGRTLHFVLSRPRLARSTHASVWDAESDGRHFISLIAPLEGTIAALWDLSGS